MANAKRQDVSGDNALSNRGDRAGFFQWVRYLLFECPLGLERPH
jgi:hypothetical protein